MTSLPADVDSSRAPGVRGVEDLLWAVAPGEAWRRWPTGGLLLSDGGWLRAWPAGALVVPAVGLLLGLGRGGWRPAEEATYSHSLLWLLAMTAVAAIGCGVGLWVWAGFVVADVVVFDHTASRGFDRTQSAADWVTGFAVPQVASYVLLALLLLGVPFTALVVRGVLTGLLRTASPRTRTSVAAVGSAVVAGVQAAAWTQAYPLLIRPLWTWRSFSVTPPTDAIAPVQQQPAAFALVAAVVAAAATWLGASGTRKLAGTRLQPVAGPGRVTAGRDPGRRALAAVARALAVVVLLAGLVDSWTNGLIAFAVLVAGFLAQSLVLGRLPFVHWWVRHVPYGVRLLAAIVIAWLVAWQIGQTAVQTAFGFTLITATDFSPLLFGAVAGIVVVALFLPVMPAAPEPEERP